MHFGRGGSIFSGSPTLFAPRRTSPSGVSLPLGPIGAKCSTTADSGGGGFRHDVLLGEAGGLAQPPFKTLRVPKRCAEPHPLGAAPRRLGSQRFFPACPGRPLPSAQQVPGYSYQPRPLQAENSQREPTSTSVPPAKSTTAVDPTGLRRHSEIRIAHDRAPSAARATQRPHHARNVSISRNTCIDSARSDSSAARLSASARIAAAAFRRAASMRAARTTADTGEPSLVKTSSALEVSASGRNVIVSAISTSVRHSVRHSGISAAPLAGAYSSQTLDRHREHREAIRNELARYGASNPRLFGSIAQGTAGPAAIFSGRSS